MMKTPMFASKESEDCYHIIDWDSLGTACNLPLNEQLRYFENIPVGKQICKECDNLIQKG